jgi:hypothetical protein
MMPHTPDFIEEVVLRLLYRQGTDILIRHAVLASEHGDVEYAEACRAELARRETQPVQEAA